MKAAKGLQRERLKELLDRFYYGHEFTSMISRDPIEFPHRYRRPEDIEVIGFISSCFSYGKVELFKPVVEKILSLMGNNPSGFIADFDVKRHQQQFTFTYRFSDREDILCLFHILHELLKRHRSIESAFMEHLLFGGGEIGKGIEGFADEILMIDTSPVYGKMKYPHGLTHFFPSPRKGSACKRMNLFLRWMVRDKDIDFGIWRGIPKDRLVIPLDTHIGRISRCLRLTERQSSDWKTAVEITEVLKSFDPEDPLKYDFVLCHHGIAGVCRQGNGKGCAECVLRVFGTCRQPRSHTMVK
jgi:uncharacterized protein (TIGR02757 family)